MHLHLWIHFIRAEGSNFNATVDTS